MTLPTSSSVINSYPSYVINDCACSTNLKSTNSGIGNSSQAQCLRPPAAHHSSTSILILALRPTPTLFIFLFYNDKLITHISQSLSFAAYLSNPPHNFTQSHINLFQPIVNFLLHSLDTFHYLLSDDQITDSMRTPAPNSPPTVLVSSAPNPSQLLRPPFSLFSHQSHTYFISGPPLSWSTIVPATSN